MTKHNTKQTIEAGFQQAYEHKATPAQAVTRGWVFAVREGHKQVEFRVIKATAKTVLVEDAEGDQWTLGEGYWELVPAAMTDVLDRYRERYVIGLTHSGRKSLHNGDELAAALEGMSHVQVATIAELLLGLEDGELLSRYWKLNHGQIRMNSGNRIRAALKRGDFDLDAVTTAALKVAMA